MADDSRRKTSQRTKRTSVTYFYLNDDLHRKLQSNQGRDLLVAWNYPRGKRVTYHYTDWLKRYQPAFTTKQVGQLLNRSRDTINNALESGAIERPQMTYGLDENQNPYKLMWSEKDIMGLHEYLAGIHYGRPRKDGFINPKSLPTPRELRAMIRNEEILYARQGDSFVPRWRAKEI